MRRRLDVEMVRRGMATTRSEAQMAIRNGSVLIQGRPAVKAATLVAPADPITLAEPARRFVSRGGEKLEAALDRFGIGVAGRAALDAGASTGGFTDCLLVRGAERVIAVDVGYGQLDLRLRDDPRVVILERTNVRNLTPEALPFRPDLVTADLSFISLRTVLRALVSVAASGATFVLLVKPQFEAGREEVPPGGVVRDPEAWRRAIAGVARTCGDLCVPPLAVMASPLLGPAGNAEFLLHAGGVPLSLPRLPDEAQPDAWADRIDRAVADALTLRDGGRG